MPALWVLRCGTPASGSNCPRIPVAILSRSMAEALRPVHDSILSSAVASGNSGRFRCPLSNS